MKYTLLLLALAATFYSCQKTISAPVSGAPEAYAGKWNWYYSIGGFSGEHREPGKDTSISLWVGQDSTYTTFLNGVKVSGGHFNTELIPNWDSTLVIHFDQNIQLGNLRMGDKEGVEIVSDDTLRLNDAFIADGYSHFFVRGK